MKKGIRILFSPCHFIYDNTFGSEFSWAYNIADKICSINKKSVVITGSKKNNLKKKYKIFEVLKDKKLDVSMKNSLKFNYFYTKKTFSLLRNNEFDLVHHVLPFSITSTFNLYSIFKRNKLPFIIGPIQNPLTYKDQFNVSNFLKDFSPKKKKKGLFDFIYKIMKYSIKFLSKRTLKKADKIIVINEYAKKILVNEGINKNKIVIIPPGINIDDYKFVKKKGKIINLISVGYLQERKGFDLIIKSMKGIINYSKNVRLYIVGDGPYKPDLEKLTKRLNLEDYIIFTGFVPNSEVYKYYMKAHIFVGMSKSEGFATVSLEALASGLPIISSKVGGFNEVVREGYNGFLIKQKDYKTLTKKVIYLLNNKNLIRIFGKNSRKEAEKYDWKESIIPKYMKVYESVLK